MARGDRHAAYWPRFVFLILIIAAGFLAVIGVLLLALPQRQTPPVQLDAEEADRQEKREKAG